MSRVDSPREYSARILSSNSENEVRRFGLGLTYRETDPVGVVVGTCRPGLAPSIAHIGRSGRAA